MMERIKWNGDVTKIFYSLGRLKTIISAYNLSTGEQEREQMRFQILKAARQKMTFLCVVPRSMIEVSRSSRAGSTSETSVNFYQTTRRSSIQEPSS
jgi:hypothetical protein